MNHRHLVNPFVADVFHGTLFSIILCCRSRIGKAPLKVARGKHLCFRFDNLLPTLQQSLLLLFLLLSFVAVLWMDISRFGFRGSFGTKWQPMIDTCTIGPHALFHKILDHVRRVVCDIARYMREQSFMTLSSEVWI